MALERDDMRSKRDRFGLMSESPSTLLKERRIQLLDGIAKRFHLKPSGSSGAGVPAGGQDSTAKRRTPAGTPVSLFLFQLARQGYLLPFCWRLKASSSGVNCSPTKISYFGNSFRSDIGTRIWTSPSV